METTHPLVVQQSHLRLAILSRAPSKKWAPAQTPDPILNVKVRHVHQKTILRLQSVSRPPTLTYPKNLQRFPNIPQAK